MCQKPQINILNDWNTNKITLTVFFFFFFCFLVKKYLFENLKNKTRMEFEIRITYKYEENKIILCYI